MAITTYAELQTAVGNWLDRSDLTARIPEFVTLFEAIVNRDLRVRQMEQRDTTTIAAEFVALPATYLDGMSIRLSSGSSTWSLDPTPAEVLDTYQATTGAPRLFALVGSDLQFYPAPDQSYTARLTYYRTIPALSDSNTTNWLLTLAPDTYLFGTLLQASAYLADTAQAQVWADGYQNALAGLRRMHRSMGGKLRTEIAGLIDYTTYNIRTDL